MGKRHELRWCRRVVDGIACSLTPHCARLPGADAGDEVSVTLRLDRESREPVVPADLRAGLKENPEARKAFEALTTGHRHHIVVWFDSPRGMDTRIRRLGFTIDFLLKRAHGVAMSRRGRRAN